MKSDMRQAINEDCGHCVFLSPARWALSFTS